jgi:hypothetical protein
VMSAMRVNPGVLRSIRTAKRRSRAIVSSIETSPAV